MKRAAIYFFYDKQGIVDRFVEYFLKDFTKNIDYLLIVSNGKLLDDGRKKLEIFGEVVERENKGFDVWAYKTGLEKIGWDNIGNYDEIILLNNTILGPVYPFRETFQKMDKKTNLDFWGITEYFKQDLDPFNCISYGYIPDHIQSHFIAIRKNMFMSKDFFDYWNNMPMINSYKEAVGKHEAIFTKKFEELGYKWDLSVDMHNLRLYNGYPLMHCPKLLIEKFRCPIFKRRNFFHDTDDFLSQTTGEPSCELFKYLEVETDYDTDMIWETIIRNYNQFDINKNLKLLYTLSTDIQKKKSWNLKVAVIYHVYFTDILEQTQKYLSSVPSGTDVYITTDDQDKLNIIETKLSNYVFDKFEIRLIENRGRDVSSLLVGMKDVIMNYDLVCFAHDKKTTQVSPETIGASFAYKCLENILANNIYFNNIVSTFEDNPRLGMLSPPEPNHAVFYPTIGKEWGPNFNCTLDLAKKLKLKVPIEKDKPPIAPYGTMFWFRPLAMKKLYDFDWNYTDFPKEPNKIDGTILHAIERIYPFVVQDAGYYPALCMNDKFSAIEYYNLKHYVRNLNNVLFSTFEPGTFPILLWGLNRSLKVYSCLRFIVKDIIMFPFKVMRKAFRVVKKLINKFMRK